MGVQEIAKLCGFYEESHFSEIFKQLNGVSPSAYRSRQRSGDYGLFLCDSR
ncbi:AraC family transcriptional regulator [Paenibacillus sp. PK3_47]|uniref:helix-turn-helix domain-containing protein n=1 Tax=Paenibacillus sp. PK3_47 TaxID=2072642 RepID=UPI003183B18A